MACDEFGAKPLKHERVPAAALSGSVHDLVAKAFFQGFLIILAETQLMMVQPLILGEQQTRLDPGLAGDETDHTLTIRIPAAECLVPFFFLG